MEKPAVKIVVIAAAALCSAALFLSNTPRRAMLDPAIDDPAREWCYLGKSTTVIGVPWQPDVTQVTFDGALFTRSAELSFFFGPNSTPMLARQKTFLEGWIPVVGYAWTDGAIRYEWEAFAAALDGRGPENTVNFVRLRATNTGAAPARAFLASAMRHNGGDYRFTGWSRDRSFSRSWHYDMDDDSAIRDGKLVYTFPAGGRREAVPGEPFTAAFAGPSRGLTASSPACLARYELPLAPGQTIALDFKMPRVPVALSDRDFIADLRAAGYEAYRERTVRWWKDLLASGASFEIPEARPQDAWAQSLVHMILATRTVDGKSFMSDGLPYPWLFLTGFVQHELAYDFTGHPEFVRGSLDMVLERQGKSGLFRDLVLTQGNPLPVANGHTLHLLATHCLVNRDRDYARKIYPAIRRSVAWFADVTGKNKYGLVPPAYPYDNEMILGHYTSNNLWMILGLRSAIRLARFLGEDADAAAWTALHEKYQAAVLRAIDASTDESGYVRTGLYRYITGQFARIGFKEFRTDCDWENMLLVEPTEVLPPSDPRVAATLKKVREGYAEGVMTYGHGRHIHQYITANMAEQYMAIGDLQTALRDFYHILLHSGSTGEGFEFNVEPWVDRMVGPHCPPPHAWASSKLLLLIRNMLVQERGGRAGLDAGERDLYLFPVVSPAWVAAGKRVAIHNAPTEFGRVTAAMAFDEGGARVTIEAAFDQPPRHIVVSIPYFVELQSFTSDDPAAAREGNAIVLGPSARTLDLKWRVKEEALKGEWEKILLGYRGENSFLGADWRGRAVIAPGRPFLLESEKRDAPEPLSFNLVVDAFRHEYARRYAEFLQAGGKPTLVEAP